MLYPPAVYNAVKQWVNENIYSLEECRVIRPFYPGGDYESYDYQPGDVVVDNPPFSILAKIRRFYQANNIKYFLFAPGLTLFASPIPHELYVVTGATIEYENGAKVVTSFITNMNDVAGVMVAGDLTRLLKKIQVKTPKAQRKLSLPGNVITSARLHPIANAGIRLHIPSSSLHRVSSLDNMNGGLFGGGFLISEKAAAEKAAAEKAAAEKAAAEKVAAEKAAAEKVALSDREQEIISKLF